MNILNFILENIPSILAGLGGLTGLTSIRLVQEGELGSKTLFGKAIRKSDGVIKVIKPGFTLVFPGLNTIRKTHIRMQTILMSGLNVTLKTGLSYHYDIAMAYHVADNPKGLEKYLYQVDEPQEAIELKLSTEIREILSGIQKDEAVDLKKINDKLKENLSEYLLNNIGITLDSCGLTSFTESTTAQAVKATEAKINLVKTLYGTNKIPDVVLAACLGATPIVQVEELKQEKGV